MVLVDGTCEQFETLLDLVPCFDDFGPGVNDFVPGFDDDLVPLDFAHCSYCPHPHLQKNHCRFDGSASLRLQ